MSDEFQKFFAPNSVVVVGASGTPKKPGNDVIRNILANEFAGELHLVNPKTDKIMGMRVYPGIQELPDGIDLAIIILPARLNPQAIRECAAKGIKAIVLAAGGFSEVDEDGAKLQEDLHRTIEETGVRVIGPNTSGHTSTPHNFTSSFFPLGKIPRGNISYIAQTGNFATHTMRYIATGEHFGVARVIGLGNKVDIEESEVLEYLARDPETKAIFIYLESIKKPRTFFEVARRVTRKKPVGGVKVYHTVAHFACAYASGQSTMSTVVSKIWDKFKAKLKKPGPPPEYEDATTPDQIFRAEDTFQNHKSNVKKIKYYGAGSSTPMQSTTSSLLENADGNCGAWVRFFRDILRAHGDNSGVHKEIITKDQAPPWNGYGFKIYVECRGQNKTKPYFSFRNHAVLKYGGILYDPSYGRTYDDLLKWEDASVNMLIYKHSVTGATVDLPDTKGVPQTDFK